jgi:purine catabolism regulator
MTVVGTRGEEWGRLIVPRAAADTARATKVLERAAVALAMDRMIERDRAGLHQQAQSGLIDEVLRDRMSDEREIAVRAHALGLRKASRYFPVTVRVRYHLTGADPLARQRRNVALLDAVGHAVNASGHTGLFATRSDGEVGAVIALSSNRAGGADRAWNALGDAVNREAMRIDGVQHSVLAVGTPADLVTDATHGLTDSAHVAEVALAMDTRDRQFYRASDVRLRGLISLLQNDSRVQAFAETELKALLTTDRGGPRSDLTVLREYLRLGGNKAALAARLHISRPSLYKRLTAIERTLGVDLTDAESMVSLHVAMLVLEVRRGADSAVAG